MALVKTLNGHTPIFGKDCFLAENATVIGQVSMGDSCSIWYGAVLRGDVHFIRMGNRVNIQDGAVIHCTYQKSSCQRSLALHGSFSKWSVASVIKI